METLRLSWICSVLYITFILLRPAISTKEGLVKPGGCPRRVLPPDRCVWNQTDECASDSDCSGVAKCCSTGCAKFCVMPVYTACEQQVQFSRRRSKALGGEAGRRVRLPECDEHGEFKPIQCDPHSSNCWCVDKNGFEVAGTRARSLDLVNCSKPAECGAVTCRMLCPYSFKLDERGCPLCQCWDPCQGVECPGQLSCQLEEVPCSNEPCPPVPTCKQPRSLETLCAAGRPLTFAEGSRPFLCGTDPGKPECPPLHECTVPTGAEYGVCCPSVEKALAPPERCPALPPGQPERCGVPCQFDFQCSRYDTCCRSHQCGTHCIPTTNMTKCQQKRKLAELMIVNEKEGRGYIPQCDLEGRFERRQCSRNGLVCWCVDREGNNVRGTMAPAERVVCEPEDVNRISAGRALTCMPLRCAEVCPYGHRTDPSGCATCQCARPCDEYPCPEGTQCVAHPHHGCRGPYCQVNPVCVPVGTTVTLVEYAGTGPGLEEALVEENAVTEQDPAEWAQNEADWREQPREDDSLPEDPIPSPQVIEVPLQGDWIEIDEGSGDEEVVEPPVMSVLPPRSADVRTVVGSVVDVLRKHVQEAGEGRDLELLADQYSEVVELPAEMLPPSRDQEEVGTEDSPAEPAEAEAEGEEDVMMTPVEIQRRNDVTDESPIPAESPDVFAEPVERNNVNEEEATPTQKPDVLKVIPDWNEVIKEQPGPTEKPGQCPFTSPVEAGSCDFECATDTDCDGVAKCCSNGCGTQCVQPLLVTGCQHQKRILEDRARSLGIPLGRTYIPHCRDSDGHFSEVQCHPVLNVCWCVDEAGQERPGTRAAGRHNVNCQTDVASVCPELRCPAYCPSGRRLDTRGCPTCQCSAPCDDVTCPDGLECRSVQLRCITGPCPPAALCLPPERSPCQQGSPLGGATCGPGQPTCPGTHHCYLSPLQGGAAPPTGVCCPKPREVCQLPAEWGRCVGSEHTRWHFDRDSKLCRKFLFSGCGGNLNNFNTQRECMSVCPVLTPCQQKRERNQLAAQLYRRVAFVPKCDPTTGAWEPVQCQPEFGLCWCVDRNGTQVPGTVTRGLPSCSFRQARRINLHRPVNICDRGETVHVCDRSLCDGKVCLNDPTAICRIDPCGGCHYRFYDTNNNEVNCSNGLTPCQREEQQVLNSAAWRNHGQYEARDRASVRLYAALLGILSQRPSDGSGSEVTHQGGLLADGIPATPPVCDRRGLYRPEQGAGGLMWCVKSDGSPNHASLTRGIVRCDQNGEVLERQSLGPVCPAGVKRRVCRHECTRAVCPGHRDAICVADPCNNCHVTFYSVSGREVQCAERCAQPVTSGKCRGSIPRYFYNRELGKCQPFLYGGCAGNDNNFHTLQDCRTECEKPVDVCSLPVTAGPCTGSHTRWFFNPSTDECEPFNYGGCGGNANNFASLQACRARCPDLVMCPTVSATLSVCSRGQACSSASCPGHPGASCRVEPCSCQPYFTDANGERLRCQAEAPNTAEYDTEVVVINAVPKTLARKKAVSKSRQEPVKGQVPVKSAPVSEGTTQPSPAPAPPLPDDTVQSLLALKHEDVLDRISSNQLEEAGDEPTPESSTSTSTAAEDELTGFAVVSPAGDIQQAWQPAELPVQQQQEPVKQQERQRQEVLVELLEDIPPAVPSPPSQPPITDQGYMEGFSGRQGRLLADLAERQVWADLRASGGSRPEGRLSAAEDRYVALQREVVARRTSFPLTAAAIVICSLSVTVIAAAIIGVIVYRRRNTGAESEETSGSSTSGSQYSGRSLHEQLSRQQPAQQPPAFRWNF